jgi:uncharacterized protein (TIGR02145 family)
MKTVKIGNQEWMAENLHTFQFRNHEFINYAYSKKDWEKVGKEGKPALCNYDNDKGNGKKYGILYNWYAVNDQGVLLPMGWHIPTKEEIETLMANVNNDVNALKEVGQDSTSTNISGFSALLSGLRFSNGEFDKLGCETLFWSSTDGSTKESAKSAYHMNLDDNGVTLQQDDKSCGFSIRCVKD